MSLSFQIIKLAQICQYNGVKTTLIRWFSTLVNDTKILCQTIFEFLLEKYCHSVSSMKKAELVVSCFTNMFHIPSVTQTLVSTPLVCFNIKKIK